MPTNTSDKISCGTGHVTYRHKFSSASNSNSGIVAIKVKLDDGNMTGGATGTGPVLTPTMSDAYWSRKKFQQNIQRAAGNVIVEYRTGPDAPGKTYALVGDYNFIYFFTAGFVGRQAVRYVMTNSSHAAQLNLTNPTLSFNEMIASRMDDYAGNTLYRKIISDAHEATSLRPASAPNGCFVAGTLVHTKTGLVSIEQVRVGDWVLSQPENKGASGPSYKQVVNTFAFDDKEIILVRFYTQDGKIDQVGVTENHPFWVKDVGWTHADQLGSGSTIELHDGDEAITLCAHPLYRTAGPGVAWATTAWGVEANDGSGKLIDLRSQSISVGTDDEFIWEILDDESQEPHFKTRVFNLEIDGFHTYYVGELGAWVHNTNCGDIGVSLFEAVAKKLSKVDEGIRYPSNNGGCFAKGTPVHTKNGFKPIEIIKVGDYVLSSQEDGTGSPTFKRVVNVFVHKEKTIREVSSYGPNSETQYFVTATGNHPFWVEGVGWTRADELKVGNLVRKADGGFAEIANQRPIYRTERDGVGWVQSLNDVEGSYGSLFDYKNHDVVPDDGKDPYLSPEVYASGDPYLKVTVYNLEVEDFHTYYVGVDGVLVHNTNCLGVELSNGKDVKPDINSPLYESGKVLDDAIAKGTQSMDGFVVVCSVYAGDALYKKVIKNAVDEAGATRGVLDPVGCFVAGTVVHTKDGLVPIEKIKIGDWVLSQPESQGPRSYKRVVNTFRFEDKEVYLVKWFTAEARRAARSAGTTIDVADFHSSIVTGNHPFWLKGLGWTRADRLEYDHELELADGQTAIVSSVDQVHRTAIENVGWVRGVGIDDDYGRLLDLRGGLTVIGQDRVLNEDIEWWEDGNWFRPAVYNLEVEDDHTYYVGQLGVWVHNTNCAGDVAKTLDEARGSIIPSRWPRRLRVL